MKRDDDIKDAGQKTTVICRIKTDDQHRLSHLCNELENGTILEESINIHPNNIAKAYVVLYKYKIP